MLIGLLAWSWLPVEMHKVVSLFADARNMAQYASAFLKPDFHDWLLVLEEMLLTVQIAIWGTALAPRPFSSLPGRRYSGANRTSLIFVTAAVGEGTHP